MFRHVDVEVDRCQCISKTDPCFVRLCRWMSEITVWEWWDGCAIQGWGGGGGFRKYIVCPHNRSVCLNRH